LDAGLGREIPEEERRRAFTTTFADTGLSPVAPLNGGAAALEFDVKSQGDHPEFSGC
jgi:hypothetical protein